MSDIRFNQWLHQSGTGGVSQSDGGHVGIGTTNPLIPVGAGNTHILNVGVVTCNNISAGSSITAGTFYGSGSNLTGITQTTINNYASTRIVTATNNANELDAETNLTVNGSLITFAESTLVVNKGTNPTISTKETAGNKELQLRANTTGGLVRTVGSYPLVFGIAQVEKLRIDTSGRLLIGTTTEGHAAADDLTIATSGSTGITIRSGTSSEGNIFFSDATSGDAEYAGFITYDHSTNNMRFTTNATERLRILSNGRVGVGTDSPLSVLTAYGENRGEGTVTGQITAKDNAAYNASPTAGLVFQGHYSSNNAQAIFAGITGFKENANDGNYAGALALHTRANGSVAQERLRITSTGSVLSSTSFVSKATADVNVTISTASGFTANTYVTVINHGVLEEESVYIISFKWNHQTSSQQPYFSHGAFVFNPSEVNTGSTGGQGPNHIPFQGHHMHTGVNRYWSFRYYGATGGTSVHGLQAAFDQTLDQGSGAGILTIRATKIAKVTTI